MTPDLSVVIPNYRKPDLVRRCLASLRVAIDACADDIEVVVVDDGSGDGAAPRLQAEHPWVMVVELERNGGFPAAVNTGIRVTHGEWLFMLNNDTTVDPGVFGALMDAARSAPDVGSLAAQQRFGHDRTLLCSAGIVVDRLGVAGERLIGEPVSASESHPVPVFGASAAAAAYRRSMVEEIGGFDESYVFGFEDVDLAWRAQMQGWRCLYVPKAVVFHDHGATVALGSDYRFLQAGRNRVRLIAKNADRGTLLRYGWLMVLYDFGYVAYALIVHHTLDPLRGRIEVARHWRDVRRAGERNRRPVRLAPVQGVRAALRRHSSWLRG